MKKLFSIFFAVILFTSINFAQDTDADMMALVEEMGDRMEVMMIKGDYEGMWEYYTDDVISMPSYQPMVVGLDKIKEMSESEENRMNFTAFEMEPFKVYADGNYMYEVGTYTLTMELPEMEMPYTDKGKYINIYEKQEDGSWKIAVETWNSDINPWEEMEQMQQMHHDKPPMEEAPESK